MNEIIDIIYRLRKGQSERTIAKALGYHRATVHQYHRFAREKGYLDPEVSLPQAAELLSQLGDQKPPPRWPSTVEPYAALVESWHAAEVEMKAIHRLLCEEHGYRGSYSSVRRFVAARHPVENEGFVRLETKPGEEAQVDFGTAGKLLDPVSGKERVGYCFVMTLSCSRHQYVEFVFDQKMPTFVGCHRRAFAYFGGVVERVVIDNLKAAVLKADLSDPLLSSAYRQMAQHYGFLISPCRPRTPEHKGKVESGVHYVKRNLFPGVAGRDLRAANKAALVWVEGYAGGRTHGTTKKQPLPHFLASEKGALKALPAHPFELCELREALVHKDCHITVGGSYYSAPEAYVGKRLEVHVFENTVQLYDGVKLLFTHQRARQRGERVTHTGHYPKHKAEHLRRTVAYCQERAVEIGPACQVLVEALLSDRPKDRRRTLAALMGLADQYGVRRLEAACGRAIACQDARYIRVKSILTAGLEEVPLPEPMLLEPPSPSPQYRYARSAEEFFGAARRLSEEVSAC